MRARRGFTLIEIMIALVILSVVALGLGASSGHFLHVVATSDRTNAAIQLANDRIAWAQLYPSYATLDSALTGVDSAFPTLPGMRRTTQVVHVGGAGQATDFKRVTVLVDGPGLLAPLERTVTVAAP